MLKAFPTALKGVGFDLKLVRADLKIPFSTFVDFRNGAWADCATTKSSRIAHAGFTSELHTPKASWKELLQGGDDGAALYVVRIENGSIVGLVRLVQSGDTMTYARVLYRRSDHRGGLHPDRVLRALIRWLRDREIRVVRTGRVLGPAFDGHVSRCRFVKDGAGDWVLHLSQIAR